MTTAKPTTDLHHRLIDAADCLLAVIDVQDRFVDRLPAAERALLIRRIAWITGAAVRLGVPVVAMAEDLARVGAVVGPVAARFAPGQVVHDKQVYGLAGNPAILADVLATGRRTAVLVGLDTDVCVAHSALGLLQHGLAVVAVADAVAAPGIRHQAGLDRLRGAGVLLSSVQSLFYEWTRSVAGTRAFMQAHGRELGDFEAGLPPAAAGQAGQG